MHSEPSSLVAQLEKQLRFEQLLATISTRFANLAPEKVDDQIIHSLQLVCEELGLDRSGVGQVTPDGRNIIVNHSWAAAGFDVVPNISASDLPYSVEVFRAHGEIRFSAVDDLPDRAKTDKATFRAIRTNSFAGFPLYVGDSFVGAAGFDSIQDRYEWPEHVVERLRIFCQLLANALVRKWNDRSLREAYNKIEKLNEQLRRENIQLREEIKLEHSHREIIGNTEAIKRILRQAEQVATTESTVLLLGETGTGKELVARTIHEHSKRASRPMVKVNCAALPATLIESELFGREKGAYTGALSREMGRFELADQSTIFLDEVGDLPLELQPKLLRVLQEGEFERLGSSKTVRVNARVIAATSRDLSVLVKERRFREDLFYRLNVFPITLPPLRERREDIPALVWHFIREIGEPMGRNIESMSSATMKALQAYAWPGNIRELRNLIERSLIVNATSELHVDLPFITTSEPTAESMEQVERLHIRNVLQRTEWRIRGVGGAAAILGMKPSTLESRLKKLGISRTDA